MKLKLKKYLVKLKIIDENKNRSFSKNANSLFLLSETHPLLVTFTWVPANMINVLVTEQYTKGCWRCLCTYLLCTFRLFNGNPCWNLGQEPSIYWSVVLAEIKCVHEKGFFNFDFSSCTLYPLCIHFLSMKNHSYSFELREN